MDSSIFIKALKTNLIFNERLSVPYQLKKDRLFHTLDCTQDPASHSNTLSLNSFITYVERWHSCVANAEAVLSIDSERYIIPLKEIAWLTSLCFDCKSIKAEFDDAVSYAEAKAALVKAAAVLGGHILGPFSSWFQNILDPNSRAKLLSDLNYNPWPATTELIDLLVEKYRAEAIEDLSLLNPKVCAGSPPENSAFVAMPSPVYDGDLNFNIPPLEFSQLEDGPVSLQQLALLGTEKELLNKLMQTWNIYPVDFNWSGEGYFPEGWGVFSTGLLNRAESLGWVKHSEQDPFFLPQLNLDEFLQWRQIVLIYAQGNPGASPRETLEGSFETFTKLK